MTLVPNVDRNSLVEVANMDVEAQMSVVVSSCNTW
jgi:hypothetical protein